MFRFRELDSAGNEHQTLEGSPLEDALRTWSQFADESASDTAITQLERELRRCKQRRDVLKSVHDKLVVQHTTLADQIAQLANVSSTGKTELQTVTEQLQVHNSSVRTMCTYYI